CLASSLSARSHLRYLPHPFSLSSSFHPLALHSFPTRRSSDLRNIREMCYFFHYIFHLVLFHFQLHIITHMLYLTTTTFIKHIARSEEHTSELQSRFDLVCRLLLEKKKIVTSKPIHVLQINNAR